MAINLQKSPTKPPVDWNDLSALAQEFPHHFGEGKNINIHSQIDVLYKQGNEYSQTYKLIEKLRTDLQALVIDTPNDAKFLKSQSNFINVISKRTLQNLFNLSLQKSEKDFFEAAKDTVLQELLSHPKIHEHSKNELNFDEILFKNVLSRLKPELEYFMTFSKEKLRYQYYELLDRYVKYSFPINRVSHSIQGKFLKILIERSYQYRLDILNGNAQEKEEKKKSNINLERTNPTSTPAPSKPSSPINPLERERIYKKLIQWICNEIKTFPSTNISDLESRISSHINLQLGTLSIHGKPITIDDIKNAPEVMDTVIQVLQNIVEDGIQDLEKFRDIDLYDVNGYSKSGKLVVNKEEELKKLAQQYSVPDFIIKEGINYKIHEFLSYILYRRLTETGYMEKLELFFLFLERMSLGSKIEIMSQQKISQFKERILNLINRVAEMRNPPKPQRGNTDNSALSNSLNIFTAPVKAGFLESDDIRRNPLYTKIQLVIQQRFDPTPQSYDPNRHNIFYHGPREHLTFLSYLEELSKRVNEFITTGFLDTPKELCFTNTTTSELTRTFVETYITIHDTFEYPPIQSSEIEKIQEYIKDHYLDINAIRQKAMIRYDKRYDKSGIFTHFLLQPRMPKHKKLFPAETADIELQKNKIALFKLFGIQVEQIVAENKRDNLKALRTASEKATQSISLWDTVFNRDSVNKTTLEIAENKKIVDFGLQTGLYSQEELDQVNKIFNI